MTDQKPTLAHAAWYAARGIPVFPLKPGGKVPATRNGVLDATTNPHRLHALFRDGKRQFNIGLATGYVMDVIDIDTRDWEIIEHATLDLAEDDWIGVARTPRGGCHIWIPVDPEARNAVGMLPGIDYRTRGGYVVAPPSYNVELGAAWTWIDPPRLERTR